MNNILNLALRFGAVTFVGAVFVTCSEASTLNAFHPMGVINSYVPKPTLTQDLSVDQTSTAITTPVVPVNSDTLNSTTNQTLAATTTNKNVTYQTFLNCGDAIGGVTNEDMTQKLADYVILTKYKTTANKQLEYNEARMNIRKILSGALNRDTMTDPVYTSDLFYQKLKYIKDASPNGDGMYSCPISINLTGLSNLQASLKSSKNFNTNFFKMPTVIQVYLINRMARNMSARTSPSSPNAARTALLNYLTSKSNSYITTMNSLTSNLASIKNFSTTALSDSTLMSYIYDTIFSPTAKTLSSPQLVTKLKAAALKKTVTPTKTVKTSAVKTNTVSSVLKKQITPTVKKSVTTTIKTSNTTALNKQVTPSKTSLSLSKNTTSVSKSASANSSSSKTIKTASPIKLVTSNVVKSITSTKTAPVKSNKVTVVSKKVTAVATKSTPIKASVVKAKKASALKKGTSKR